MIMTFLLLLLLLSFYNFFFYFQLSVQHMGTQGPRGTERDREGPWEIAEERDRGTVRDRGKSTERDRGTVSQRDRGINVQ